MAIVWLVIQALFVCLFFSLPAPERLPTKPVIPDETTPLVTEKLHSEQYTINSAQSYSHKACNMRVWHLIKEETVVLLAVLFVVMFQQTALEVSINIMTAHYVLKSLTNYRQCVFQWPKIYCIGRNKKLVDFIV